MQFTSQEMRGVVEQLNSVHAQLTQRAGTLMDAAIWSGADAQRFARDYDELVLDPIRRAAGRLEALQIPDLV